MREYRFHHVDVFTQTPFEGNPLAVFTNPQGLDDATMQRIAREMNLSETVFLFPPSGAGAVAALRIFTPFAELPFAGHPTIGSAFVLHEIGALGGLEHFTLEERIGPVPIRLEGGEPFVAWLTSPPVSFEPPLEDRAGIARALGLDHGDLRADRPIRVASAGNPFLYVPLCDEAAVDRAALEQRELRLVAGDVRTTGVYVFAVREGGAYSRMFAPESGIIEDPATGSATGPLAAYLLAECEVEAPCQFVAEQGTGMGRRSILRVRVSGTGASPQIEVGGSAAALIEGVLRLPEL